MISEEIVTSWSAEKDFDHTKSAVPLLVISDDLSSGTGASYQMFKEN